MNENLHGLPEPVSSNSDQRIALDEQPSNPCRDTSRGNRWVWITFGTSLVCVFTQLVTALLAMAADGENWAYIPIAGCLMIFWLLPPLTTTVCAAIALTKRGRPRWPVLVSLILAWWFAIPLAIELAV